MNALSTEFAKDGELSDETLKLLADKGFDKKAVDGFIAGQQAIAEKLSSALTELAGGKEKLAATFEWAKANLSEADIAAYDAAVDSGNLGLTKLALQGVIAQYNEAVGTDPALITGVEALKSTDSPPFANNAQVVAAMQDPRYKTDEEYRQKVAARLANTSTFGQR
jgi:lysozyme family protein